MNSTFDPSRRPRHTTDRRTAPSARRSVLTFCLAATALVACGGGAAPVDDAPSPPGGLTDAEMEALYRARTDSARQHFTEADVRFVTGMIAHHAQAIVMSEMAPTHGASSTLRTLAARIINAQRDEITRMQQWLRDRGRPAPVVDASGIDGVVPGAAHAGMPGMLSRAQLEDLDAARGADFDRLFLTYMIDHHAGAVTMVHRLFATDGAAQDEAVFKLASDIQVDQRTEIARMEQLLEAMPPGGVGGRGGVGGGGGGSGGGGGEPRR